MKTYLELDAFELGLLRALIAGADPANLPKSFVEKVRKAVDQVYLDSGFSEEQVCGKPKKKKKET